MPERPTGRPHEQPFVSPFLLFDRAQQEQARIVRRTLLAQRATRMLWSKDYRQKPAALEAELTEYGRPALGEEIAAVMGVFVPVESGKPRPKIREDAAGIGAVTGALLGQGYDVTAADISGEFTDHIERKYAARYPGQLRTLVHDMNEPPDIEEFEAYDGITTVWSNRYIDDPQKYLAHKYAKLKRGGVFVWVVHNEESAPWKLFSENPQQVTDINGLAQLAETVGFDDIRSFSGEPVPPFDGFPVIVTPQFLVLTKN